MRRLAAGVIASFVCVHCAWGALTADVTTSANQSTASTSVTTASFSTISGQELLLALISTDYVSGSNTTVKSVSGAGLTWTLVVRTNAQSGASEIWRAFAPATLSSVTVTATLSQNVVSSMTVMSFTGADPSGTNGSGAIGAVASASASTGPPSATLVTTRNNSWVVGVGNDYDNAIARTVGPSQSLLHQYLTPSGDTYWVQTQTSPTPLSGTSVKMNDTAPTTDRFNLSICEILPSSTVTQTWSAAGNVSPSSEGVGAAITATGTMNAGTVADTSGNYTLTGLINGTYTLTASKSGFTFVPSTQALTISDANQTGLNFAAQPVPTWGISGAISPAANGSGTSVMLSGGANSIVSADSVGNYTFTGLANGAYTITPSKPGYSFNPSSQPVSLNGVNKTGINFVATAPSNTLAVDATVSSNQSAASTTITTPPFSTASGQELLLALISTDYVSGNNTTVQSVTGAGLTWVLVVRTNAQSGSSEIWRAFAPATLSAAAVTATLSQKVVSSITVMSFTGADPSGTNGSGAVGATASGSASTGAPAATLATTRNNSWVVGVGNDFDNAITRTAPAGQTLLNQYLTPTGDTYWAQMQTNPTPLSGTSVKINDTSPTSDRFNLSICEILANSGGTSDATPPVVSMTSPTPGIVGGQTTVSASVSDNVAISGVQFLLDGSPLAAQVTVSPYSISWDTTTAASGAHTLAARAQNVAGQATTSSSIAVTVDNSGNMAAVGSWSSPLSLPAVAVNLILLRNNKVLFYQDGVTPTVWDYVQNTFINIPAPDDLFCSGAALLTDGRVLIVGGYGESNNTIGVATAEIFDPTANSWTSVPKMSYRRWYPTATTLSDGRILVTAGWQTTAHSNAGISEIYDPAKNSWSQLPNANNPFETYPFLYQLPDGRIIHIGGSEYATDTDVLDLTTQTWSVIDSRIIDGASATMFLPGQFIKAGAATDSQGVGPASNTTFVLDTTKPAPAWQQTASMAYPRSYLNLTMLPDGTVLATGGETDKNGGTIANAVYAAELWSPQTQTWSTMASMHTPREYHGTALLLPDGRVLESGMGADFGNVPDEKSAEFYSPPYLFKGPRPTIAQSPSQLAYGANFFVGTPDAPNITKVVLIRTGAVTHFFDQNERYVPLTFQHTSGGLTVTAPANAYLAPPGYYMLFIVNNAGVPSVAPFVQLPSN